MSCNSNNNAIMASLFGNPSTPSSSSWKGGVSSAVGSAPAASTITSTSSSSGGPFSRRRVPQHAPLTHANSVAEAMPSASAPIAVPAAAASTPRRPHSGQAKRMPRRSTVSFSAAGSPPAPATTSICNSSQPHYIHHSSSGPRHSPSYNRPASLPHASSLGSYATPRKGGSSSPFAGSAFSDSPSARAIPLPPMTWFLEQDDCCGDAASSSCDADSGVPSSISSTSSSQGSSDAESDLVAPSSARCVKAASSLPAFPSPHSGLRINPLQLIAAASAS